MWTGKWSLIVENCGNKLDWILPQRILLKNQWWRQVVQMVRMIESDTWLKDTIEFCSCVWVTTDDLQVVYKLHSYSFSKLLYNSLL